MLEEFEERLYMYAYVYCRGSDTEYSWGGGKFISAKMGGSACVIIDFARNSQKFGEGMTPLWRTPWFSVHIYYVR